MKNNYAKLQNFYNFAGALDGNCLMKLIDTILTLGKVALKSRKTGENARQPRSNPLIIMGNGPSLRQTIEEHSDILMSCDTTAVNFAANTPEFFRIKPSHYILADPHFFEGGASDPNVRLLWENLGKADWPMTLHIPAFRKASGLPENISVQRYNLTPGEGYDAFCHPLFRNGLAMPRPRNVLIPAIMEGIRDGYREIYIVGADHTWPHTLYVDDSNRVVSVQPHFYEDNKKELDRVAQEYSGLHIHDVLSSMVVAFRSYHEIRRYADKSGIRIFNSTPGSLIDAFTRQRLP